MEYEEFANSPLCGPHDLLEQLYKFDKLMDDNDWGHIFGLNLGELEPYEGTVLCDPQFTPTNSLSFARTGGDDVHFGLLSVAGKYGDNSPVVMTVPMADDNPNDTNFIVGSTLREFLCLGCQHGFFDLEKIAYPWKTELFELHARGTPEEDRVYREFRERLGLEPWHNLCDRLAELNAEFRNQLQFASTR